MKADEVERALKALNGVMEQRSLRSDLVILGGASLVVRNLTARATSDVDVLGIRLPDGIVQSASPLPIEVRAAADDVALALDLAPMWLDDRPGLDFVNAAPDGFENRLERVSYGALVVWHLSERDILLIKIIASAERWGEQPNKHWEDARALGIDGDTLDDAYQFAKRIWADESAAWSALAKIREHFDGQ